MKVQLRADKPLPDQMPFKGGYRQVFLLNREW